MAEKTKRKGKPKRKRPATQKIEFVSPLPIEECCSRLEALADWKGRFISLNSTRVYLTPVDSQTWDYEIGKWKYLNFVAKIVGQLEYRDVSSTFVTGDAKIPNGLYLMRIWFIIFGFVFLLGTVINGNLVALLFWLVYAAILAINWLRIVRWRDELLYLVEDTLGK